MRPWIALSLLSVACASTAPTTAPAAAGAASGDAVTYDQYLLGIQSYLDLNKPQQAQAAAAEAVHLAPERPEAYVLWGHALAIAEQTAGSIEKYEAARGRGSREAALFAELGSAYDVLKRYSEAEAVYRDFLKDHPLNVEILDELAVTLLLENKPDDAVSILTSALAALPDNLQLKQDLGYAYLRAKKFEPARDVLLGVVQQDSNRIDALRFLAQAYAGLGSLDKARPLLTQVLAATPTDRSARMARARLEALDGAPQLAFADYQTLLAERPNDGPMLLGEAGALIAMERLDDAQRALEEARGTLGDHPQARFRQAQIDWRRGRNAAIAVLETFTTQPANADEAWHELYLAARHFGNATLAKKAQNHLNASHPGR